MCISGWPWPLLFHAHPVICTIILKFGSSDHFLPVSNNTQRFHSTLTNTWIGIEGEDWSFDAVTFSLHRPLISLHVTRQKSKESVTSEVWSSNLTAHPPVHPPIHLIQPSVQPCNMSCAKKKGEKRGAKHLTMTCRPSVTLLKWKIHCV